MQIRAVPMYSEALGTLLKGAAFSTHVRGQCMSPLIEDHSKITVEPGTGLRCGDVMLWQDEAGQFTCHRYLGRFPGRRGFGAVSWADNSHRPDGLVCNQAIFGRVSSVDDELLHIGIGDRLRARLRYFRYCGIRIRRFFG